MMHAVINFGVALVNSDAFLRHCRLIETLFQGVGDRGSPLSVLGGEGLRPPPEVA